VATTYKILGQTNPTSGSSSTEANLYTVGSNKLGAVVSTLTVCNTGSNAATYSIVIRQGGQSLTPKQYFAYNASVPSNVTTTYTVGITLGANDIIGVYTSSTTLAFQAFGSELS
jgi:hypothetical protein